MADNLGVQFFNDAKAQFESAGKWRWVVAALLAYLHVGLVVPFAADMRAKAEIDRQLVPGRAAQAALKPVLEEADKLASRVNEAENRVAAGLKAELVERFEHLSTAVNALAALDPSQAEGQQGAALFGASPRLQMQQLQTTPNSSTLPPMSAQLRRRIAETAKAIGPGEVPPELQAYIDPGLIAPAFTRANQAWQASGKSIAQDGVAAIADLIAKAEAPAAAAELDRLGTSVEALGQEAQRLTFARPSDPTWWRTIRGKEASIVSMTSDFAASVGNFNSSQLALQKQTAEIADIVRQNQEAATVLKGKLDDLEKRAAALQSQLGEIGAPLKVIAFKLAEIAPLTPLIIAAALATVAGWTAEGLRRMVLAAKLVGDEADGTTIRTWLRAMAGGSRARVAGVELAVAIVSIAWVLAAALTVSDLPPPLLTQPVLTAIAVMVAGAARAYRWRRADEAASVGSR